MSTDLTGIETKAAHMADEAREANAAIKRVMAIHQPIDAVMYDGSGRQHPRQVCTGCGTDDGNWQTWPCPTVRAIRSA